MDAELSALKEFLADAVAQAPVGIVVVVRPDYVVRMANEHYLQMVDQKENTFIGRPIFEALPELRAVAEPLLNKVVETGQPFYGNEIPTLIRQQGKVVTAYYNFVYKPLKRKDDVQGVIAVATDVTALVESKKQLQEGNEKFQLMVSQSPIAMAILRGAEWVIELANDTILGHVWRRKREEVQGTKLLSAFPELSHHQFTSSLRKVFADGVSQTEKEVALNSGGPYSFVDIEYTPLFNNDTTVSGVLVTVNDVTEKVTTRRTTEENETRLRMVIEASGLGTWQLDLKTGEFDYSDKYLANFGITERLSHTELLAFMHPEDVAMRDQAVSDAFKTGFLHYAARLLWRDNSVHWIEAHGKVLYDNDKKPIKIIGTSRDLTAEKVHQESIEESEKKFRLLAESMPQFIWTGDPSGNINYFNQPVSDYSGLSIPELMGQGWIRLIHPEDRVVNVEKWRESVRKREGFLFEHRLRRYDGLFRWHLSRATPYFDARGNIQMWVGTSTDIHDQKTFAKELEEKVRERTKELKKTNEVLEKTNRELEQFAYIASHDLQEPLRKIQTFADILKRNIHDEVSAKKYFSKIDSSAQRMGQLIRSVLDYSRLPPHPGQLMLADLNEILENVKNDLELIIAERTAEIQSDPLPAVPGVPLQLHQLFSNLIGNSLKFCREKPFIHITCQAVSGSDLTSIFRADPEKRYAELRFQDNGIGFDNQYKDQIFAIFQRLHGWQQYSGTGIGLALCKKIAENHEGYITAHSHPGEGATFVVYLPA